MSDQRDYARSGAYRSGGDRWGGERDARSRDSRKSGSGGGGRYWRENRNDWDGDRRPQRPAPELEEHDGIVKIWIGGLPSNITQEEIEHICDKYGSVLGVSIKSSPRDTYAFVDFGSMGNAKDAIRGLDQSTPFGNNRVKVAPAMRRGAGASAGGGSKDIGDRGDGARGGRGGDDRDRRGERKDDRGGRSNSRKRSPRRSAARRSSPRRSCRPSPGRSPVRRSPPRRSPRRSSRPRSSRRSPPRRRSPTPRRQPSPRRPRDRSRSRSRRGTAPRASSPPRKRSRSQMRRPSPPPAPPRDRTWRLVLSHLPKDMEEEEFKDITAQYGSILAQELHREGVYKAGWVEYKTKREADEAVAALDNRRMVDWDMRLQAYIYPGGQGMGGGVATK